MADSDVHEAIQLDADISALVSPSVSELWRAMHGYPAEATGAVAAHRALGGGLPVQWTVDQDTGQFTINFDDDSQSIESLVINYTGDPTDYIPLFAIGDIGGGAKQVFHIDSSGDSDHYFRDDSVSLKYHRDHDGQAKELVKIGEQNFIISNTASPARSLIYASYDDDYLELCAAASTLSFFASSGAAKQTGVAVSAAGIHAALVAYGLIAA